MNKPIEISSDIEIDCGYFQKVEEGNRQFLFERTVHHYQVGQYLKAFEVDPFSGERTGKSLIVRVQGVVRKLKGINPAHFLMISVRSATW